MGTPSENNGKTKSFWTELLELLVLAVFIVIPFRLYVAQPFIVEGASMDPTFKTGDYLIIDELSYRFKDPERGEIMIFRYPKDPKKYFIKRLVGLPGETLVIKDGRVTIISGKYPEGLTLTEPYVRYEKRDNITFTLGAGEYFVMGDNRRGSADSRLWGPVPEDNIVGRPIIRFYPPALWPGEFSMAD